MVETYVPQLDERSAVARTSRLCAAVRRLNDAGIAIRLLRSVALVEEETHLYLVAAHELGDVVRLNEQAGLEHDHVAEAVAIDVCPCP